MNGIPRFIADQSLAGLAKWLRLLGYDTVIHVQAAGRPMMRQAQAEDRIVLTRRTDMMQRQFSGRIILLPEMKTAGQLNFLIGKLSLDIRQENMYTLCIACNERLTQVDRESVRDLIPQYVYEHCRHYNQCPKCRKIYWPGTHGQNAMNYLKEHGVIIP